jgi:GrpB-like predicted nucleotidyltransferase (UPF0157 family)
MPAPIRVELVPHSPIWAQLAAAETVRIRQALGANVVAIHHVGSTAIPGIHAKPIVDLVPEVRRLASLDSAQPILESLGYEFWGEYGIPGRRYGTWDDPLTGRRRFQLHCFEAGHAEIERHLAFRDFLRANSEIARAYDAEKHRCQQLHPDDSHAYSDAKSAWISAQLALAMADYRRPN